MILCINKVAYAQLQQLCGNTHTNGAYNNNDNNPTPIIHGATQPHTRKHNLLLEKHSTSKDKG